MLKFYWTGTTSIKNMFLIYNIGLTCTELKNISRKYQEILGWLNYQRGLLLKYAYLSIKVMRQRRKNGTQNDIATNAGLLTKSLYI